MLLDEAFETFLEDGFEFAIFGTNIVWASLFSNSILLA